MTDREAKEMIIRVFDKIQTSRFICDLQEIEDDPDIPPKNKINDNTYPKIDFEISPKEIQLMIDNQLIDNDYQFTKDISTTIKDPLTKLLFAMAWKNGDLKKIRHIIQGIREVKSKSTEKEEAFVFYQFGKYLTKSFGEPLIDQHVIRAFGAYKHCKSAEKFIEMRIVSTIGKKHLKIIEEYKQWLVSDKLTDELKTQSDYPYYIDRILYATGKTIKVN